VKGHDHHLYLALLEEAKYFQIRRLEEWLGGKKYLSALNIRYSAREVEGIPRLENTDIDLSFYPEWVTKKVYICPRGFYRHEGKPNACGRDCRKAQGDADDIYREDLSLKVLVVEKQIVFESNDCLAWGGNSPDVER
jgi:BTB/POZ domain-containing protein KCTD9